MLGLSYPRQPLPPGAWQHPRTVLTALTLAGSWYLMGSPGPLALVLLTPSVLLLWRWRWPRTYSRFVTGPGASLRELMSGWAIQALALR